MPVIDAVFTPSEPEFEAARAVLAAMARADAEGRGAVELEGAMVDEASRRLAVSVVARGEAAGLDGPAAAASHSEGASAGSGARGEGGATA